MNMINVLQRLAELDDKNANVKPARINPEAAVEAIQKTLSEELSMDSLKYLSGVKNTLEECGIMPMMPQETMMPPSHPPVPASFSINATAASGGEVADMLTQIMNLAGVKPVGPQDMPLDKPHTTVSTLPPMNGNDDMKRMMDIMNKPEDESTEDEILGGNDMSPAMGGDTGGSGEEPFGDVDVSGVGGALAGAAKDGDLDGAIDGYEAGQEVSNGPEDEGVMGATAGAGIGALIGGPLGAVAGGAMGSSMEDEEFDNSPADPTKPPQFNSSKFSYDPNQGDHRERQKGLPMANPANEDLTSKLFKDYQKFVTEEEQTMSRATSNAFTQSAPYPSFKKKKPVSKEVDKPNQPNQTKPKSK